MEHDRRVYDERLTEIERKIDRLTADVEDLVTVWKAARWTVTAIKYLGGFAIGLTTLIAFVRGFK